MKHIKTYQQLNESKNEDILKPILDKFSSKIDMKGLTEFLLPNKELLKNHYMKYVKNGVIDANAIHSDFSKFNFSANESWYRKNDYADDTDNNPILRFLYKLFVRWPKSFVSGIWEFFHDTVIESFKDGGMGIVMGFFALLMWIVVAILVFLLGVLIAQTIEWGMNGLDKGKVKTELRFEPAHYELHTHTINTGKTFYTYTTNDYVPDKWHTQVEGENGRIEQWVTYNHSVGDTTKVGQEVKNDDNWSWEGTIKR